MAYASKEEPPAISTVLLILGILIMLMGINMFILYTIMGMMGSSAHNSFIYFPIIFVVLGLVSILIAKKIPTRFLTGSIMCFCSAGIWLVIWRIFLPPMEEKANGFKSAESSESSSSVSVFNPQDVNFEFYNNMFIYMIAAFIIIGIILFIIHKRQNKSHEAEETI